jgi:RNA-binding protein
VPLTAKQRVRLRALGHHLDPVVIVGQQGITPGVVAAVEQALFDHELIKVRFNEGPEDRKEGAARLARETGSEVAQILGRTALLYRQHPEKPRIDLDARRRAQTPVAGAMRAAPTRNRRAPAKKRSASPKNPRASLKKPRASAKKPRRR